MVSGQSGTRCVRLPAGCSDKLIQTRTRGLLQQGQDVADLARSFDLKRLHGVPVHVFRLAGIYGPGRSVLNDVRDGSVQRIVKKKQYFGRIHVEDIATVLRTSMQRPNPGAVYNVADDLPAPPQDVAAFACDLLGVEPPPPVAFEAAKETMSPMQLSFWTDSKRVKNERIKSELGVTLKYPDYKAGLQAILAAERQRH